MLKTSMILGDRYEIIERIGSGGMSEVYRAKDRKLNRYVAIKVLKREFSDDRNFVSKFRVEAQSAAGLNHPNIVNVYDVGEDEGFYYIVMEYIEGITLKQYIADRGRLSAEEALDFALQIASGIEEAHKNHIIHRDVKPQNIIVSSNHTLKVTDFGIARASSSNTISAGTMGSVHYISPEQARGGYSDEKSDIYSIGITLYEMVTGVLPFQGDNNISVALMHIQANITPPHTICPDVPLGLDKVIMKCTNKATERRYHSCSALIADLHRVASNPNGDFVITSNNQVNDSPTSVITPEEMSVIKSANYSSREGRGDYTGEDMAVADMSKGDYQRRYEDGDMRSRQGYDMDEDLPAHDYDDDYEDDYEDEDYTDIYEEEPPRKAVEKKKKATPVKELGMEEDPLDEEEVDPKLQKIVMIGGVVAAIIIAMCVMLLVGKTAGWFKFGGGDKNTSTEENQGIEMTLDVKGMNVADAEAALTGANIPYVLEHKNDDAIPADTVISQSYNRGDIIPAGLTVKIVVSAGKEEVPVPNVVGYDVAQAETMLRDVSLQVTHGYEYSDDVEKDKVIRQEPGSDQTVAKGSIVKIVISNGPEIKEVEVPDLRGKTRQEAEAILQNINLKLGNVTEEYHPDVPAGQVINQSTSVGTKVNEGSSVDITISKGPEATTEAPKTYSATFSGSVALIAGSTNTYNIEVCYVIGDSSRTIASGSISADNPTLMIPDGFKLTGLASQGQLQVKVNGVVSKPEDVNISVNVQLAEE